MFRKSKKQVTLAGRLGAALALGLLVTFSTYPAAQRAIAAATCSSKADCQAQINNTNNTINDSKQALSTLAGQAGTYQQAIAALQSQISDLQSQINANEAKQADLQANIAAEQAQLDKEKSLLATVVRTTYIDGQMSTIEALATSDDLSDYVNKEAYRQQVQISIQADMDKIAALQSQLNAQKQAVDTLLANQETQRSQLATARAQQASMLSYNQQQQAAYNSKVASASSDLKSLQARLAALNSVSGQTVNMSGTCGGGYPASATNNSGGHWGCNYAQDSALDNWNMYNRECVSYTSFMVNQTFGVSTKNWHNAYQWISAAQSAGFRVDQTPAPNTVAIRARDPYESGDVGHAMWVVSVQSEHSITVNEYNRSLDGKFDQRTFDPYSYLSQHNAAVYYIHFN